MNTVRKLGAVGGAIGLGISSIFAMLQFLPSEQPLPLASMQLTAQIAVAGQLTPDQVAELKGRGFATIVDMLPDGEELGQPTSAEVREAARAQRMGFAYVPLPKGEIVPDAAVVALVHALADKPEPVLLYCRTGERAARTWSLMEASRPKGANAKAILAAVRASGYSADDLAAQIKARIARRGDVQLASKSH